MEVTCAKPHKMPAPPPAEATPRSKSTAQAVFSFSMLRPSPWPLLLQDRGHRNRRQYGAGPPAVHATAADYAAGGRAKYDRRGGHGAPVRIAACSRALRRATRNGQCSRPDPAPPPPLLPRGVRFLAAGVLLCCVHRARGMLLFLLHGRRRRGRALMARRGSTAVSCAAKRRPATIVIINYVLCVRLGEGGS